VPSNALGSWCLYCFDRRAVKLFVIDPVIDHLNPSDLERYINKQEAVIEALSNAFSEIVSDMFTGWEYDFSCLSVDYVDLRGQYCEKYGNIVVTASRASWANIMMTWIFGQCRGYTGLCVLHCMRWFDGERIARQLGVVSFQYPV
jgi:hypothetical protein